MAVLMSVACAMHHKIWQIHTRFSVPAKHCFLKPVHMHLWQENPEDPTQEWFKDLQGLNVPRRSTQCQSLLLLPLLKKAFLPEATLYTCTYGRIIRRIHARMVQGLARTQGPRRSTQCQSHWCCPMPRKALLPKATRYTCIYGKKIWKIHSRIVQGLARTQSAQAKHSVPEPIAAAPAKKSARPIALMPNIHKFS